MWRAEAAEREHARVELRKVIWTKACLSDPGGNNTYVFLRFFYVYSEVFERLLDSERQESIAQVRTQSVNEQVFDESGREFVCIDDDDEAEQQVCIMFRSEFVGQSLIFPDI